MITRIAICTMVALIANSLSVHAQESVIHSCAALAESALRTFTTHRNDRAFLAVSYSSHCGEQRSFQELTATQQTSFNVAYKRIIRLGFGSDMQDASVSEHYEAFCNRDASLFQSEQEMFNEVSTIQTDALKTVELCLRSAEARITVNYTTPSQPEDLLTVTFKAQFGSQRLEGVGSRNLTCRHGDRTLEPQLADPIEITSNVINISCYRRSEPITLYGLNGTHYPRAQVTFYTNYSNQPLDIILAEGVTGPLQNRLVEIERRLEEGAVPSGSLVIMGNACPPGTYDDITASFSGRYLMIDESVATEISTGDGDGSHTHEGGSHTHPVVGKTDLKDGGLREGRRSRNAAHARDTPITGTALAATVKLDGGAHQHAFVGVRLCLKR